MSEERNYDDVVTEEAVEGQPAYEMPGTEIPLYEQAVPQEPVKAKKGFATAALVFGILAFITTLFLLNYVFGILSLIFGIVYLAKKADIKPKGKAIAGIVLSVLSLTVSTVIWVNAYNYVAKTEISQIVQDVAGLMGEEIDGEEVVNSYVAEMTGGAIDMTTIEQFVGGEVSIERVMNFVGDVQEGEITVFIDRLQNADPAVLQNIVAEFEGEITYEKLEEKLGEDFSLEELMEYIDKYISATPQE